MATSDKKLVRSKSGLRIVAINEEATSPLLLSEPPWIPDIECQDCVKCQTKFDFMKRRHHCRRCGLVFCGKCCDHKLSLPRMSFIDPVRQCADCAATTKKENEFFERHIKTLITGADFQVSKSDEDVDNTPVYFCKLSADHRFLQFENSGCGAELEEIELRNMSSVRILTSAVDALGNVLANGVMLNHKGSDQQLHELRLVALEGGGKRQAMLWVAAMQKAMKLMYGSQPSTP